MIIDKEKIFEFNQGNDKQITNLLHNALETKGRKVNHKVKLEKPVFDEFYYRMSGTTWWGKASSDQKEQYLWERNKYKLTESVLVENFGFTFNSKLMLLEEDLEIKSLHANFAFDEVAHLNMILPFLFFNPKGLEKSNPLLLEVGRCIELGDPAALNFMVQVVLEGFGLAHYTGLASACNHPEMKKVFESIIKDEAFHHGGGTLSLNKKVMNKESGEFVCELLENIVTFFSFWSHPYFRAMNLVQGVLTENQMEIFLEESNARSIASQRVEAVKKLVLNHAPAEIKTSLENIKAFNKIPTHQEMIKSYKTSVCNPEVL